LKAFFTHSEAQKCISIDNDHNFFSVHQQSYGTK
jgi:hypothetical protein